MKNESSIFCLSLSAMFGITLLIMPIIIRAEPAASLAGSLQESLKEQGWYQSKTLDGNVIYRQKPLKQQPAKESDVDRKKLGQALKGKGWNAGWQEDGSLILHPKANQNSTKSENTSVDKLKMETVLPDMSNFEYWRVVKSSDGALVFHPVTKPEASNEPATKITQVEQCDELQADLNDIELPVDRWEEVYELAHNWLSASGLKGVVVGHSRPVRRYEWFHLVNLVSEHRPYVTHYQIAIRANDGKVILLR